MLACRSLASQNVNDYERSIKFVPKNANIRNEAETQFFPGHWCFFRSWATPPPPSFLPVYALVLKMAFRLEREKCKELVTTRQPWIMNRVGETVSQRTIENLF